MQCALKMHFSCPMVSLSSLLVHEQDRRQHERELAHLLRGDLGVDEDGQEGDHENGSRDAADAHAHQRQGC